MKKQLYETEEGDLYYMNDFGDVWKLTFPDNEESKLEKHKNDLEEIKELSNDYKNIQTGVEALKYALDNSATEHGIQIREKTRKDFVDEWRERKNSEEVMEDITEDIEDEVMETLEEHEGKKSKNLETKPDYALEV